MEHKVIAKTAHEWPLLRVDCACGYWQMKTSLNFFASLWLTDEIHLLWAAQNPPAKLTQGVLFS